MKIDYQETTDDLLARIDIHSKYGRRNIDEWMLHLLNVPQGSQILDVGCGAGKQCFLFLEALQGQAEITGGDVNAEPAQPAGQQPASEVGFELLRDLVAAVDQAARGVADVAATNAGVLTLAQRVSAASAAKSVDPIFAVRFSRLLSAIRQGLLADPGLLYWPMYRGSMMDFIEERTGRPPDWNKLVFVVGDHGGSGVGLALLVEPVMSEVVSLHIHLESLDRRQAILESYMKGAAKSP